MRWKRRCARIYSLPWAIFEAQGRRYGGGAVPQGIANIAAALGTRAILDEELRWADRAALTADGPDINVLVGYRLFVVRAKVLTERYLAGFPEANVADGASFGAALGQIVSLRADVEALPA